MAKKINYVMWCGFSGSGSSAVGDLLREFDHTFECGKEIRFIKDPYGIYDLEQHLIDHWELINSLAAIHDFIRMSKIWGRYGDGPLCPPGLSYKKHINKNYYAISKKYIDRISLFEFKREFYTTKFKKNYFKYVIDRNRAYIERKTKGKIKLANRHITPNHFAVPTKEEFYAATRDYIDELFLPHVGEEGNENTILLDQPLSPNNIDCLYHYFRDAKMIIVDRDPRDIYVEKFEWGLHIDKESGTVKDGMHFAEFMKGLHRYMKLPSPNVLYIRFEDLVLHYNETKAKILEFVGFDEKDHLYPSKYFNPEISKQNVGRWKRYADKYADALNYLRDALPNQCYNPEK